MCKGVSMRIRTSIFMTILFFLFAGGFTYEIMSIVKIKGGMIAEKDRMTKDFTKDLNNEIAKLEYYPNKDDIIIYIRKRHKNIPDKTATAIAKNILLASEKYKIDFGLILGVIEVESGFNPYAKSSAGAIGLMQVMPSVWCKQFGIKNYKDLYGIATNIDCGTRVLKKYICREDGNVVSALKAYNGTANNKFSDKVLIATAKFITSVRILRNDKPGKSCNN
jgi:soluble lytic murein transglycosylase-like protein